MLKSFQPIVDEESRILVLGSMPGKESLRMEQYYAYKHNMFWPIIFGIFGERVRESYEDRILFLKRNRIALWDVISRCEREGSLDSNIKKEEYNDIPALLEEYPGIKHIFFNGGTAFRIFRRKMAEKVKGEVCFIKLPSTSPAYASKSFEDKMSDWDLVKAVLDKKELYRTEYDSIIGSINIISSSRGIVGILLGNELREQYSLNKNVIGEPNTVGRQAVLQISEYFNGRRQNFSLPLDINGTEFQKKVWNELKKIPYGETRTYIDIAKSIGNPKAVRAVGQANRNNPVPIVIPCHRVIGSKGGLVGYMGKKDTLLKEILLNHESHHSEH